MRGRVSSQYRRNSRAAKRECSWYWVEKKICVLWPKSKKGTMKAWSSPTGYSRRPQLSLLHLIPEEIRQRPLKKKKKLLLRGKAVSTVLFTGISCLMLRCTAVSIHWSREHCQLDNRLAGSALEIWHQRQVPRKLRITVNICYMMKCHHVTKLDHIIRKQLWIPMECSNHLISHSKHSFLFWPSPVPSP